MRTIIVASMSWALSAVAPVDATTIAEHRVIEIEAPSTADPRVALQRRLLAAHEDALRERDILIREKSGPEFRVRLIGKDRGVKLDLAEPIEARYLFAVIDEMPMRRSEIDARGRSSPSTE